MKSVPLKFSGNSPIVEHGFGVKNKKESLMRRYHRKKYSNLGTHFYYKKVTKNSIIIITETSNTVENKNFYTK